MIPFEERYAAKNAWIRKEKEIAVKAGEMKKNEKRKFGHARADVIESDAPDLKLQEIFLNPSTDIAPRPLLVGYAIAGPLAILCILFILMRNRRLRYSSNRRLED